MAISTLDEYQDLAGRTNIFEDIREQVLGLASEAGEVAGKVSKVYRDDNGYTDGAVAAIGYELGDLLWYVATTATYFGFSLSEIADMNITKLKSRKERGVIGGSGDHR